MLSILRRNVFILRPLILRQFRQLQLTATVGTEREDKQAPFTRNSLHDSQPTESAEIGARSPQMRCGKEMVYKTYLSHMLWHLSNVSKIYYLDAIWNSICSQRKDGTRATTPFAGNIASSGLKGTERGVHKFISAIGSKDGFLPSGVFVANTSQSQGPSVARFREFFLMQILPQLDSKSLIVLGIQHHHNRLLVELPPRKNARQTKMVAWLQQRGIEFGSFEDKRDLHRQYIHPLRFLPEYRKFELDELARQRGVHVLRIPQHNRSRLNPFEFIRRALQRPFGQRVVDRLLLGSGEQLGMEEVIGLAAGDWRELCQDVEQFVHDECSKLGITATAADLNRGSSTKQQDMHMETLPATCNDADYLPSPDIKQEVPSGDPKKHSETPIRKCIRKLGSVQKQDQATADWSRSEKLMQEAQPALQRVAKETTAAEEITHRIEELVKRGERKDSLLCETHHLLYERKQRDDERLKRLISLVHQLRRKEV